MQKRRLILFLDRHGFAITGWTVLVAFAVFVAWTANQKILLLAVKIGAGLFGAIVGVLAVVVPYLLLRPRFRAWWGRKVTVAQAEESLEEPAPESEPVVVIEAQPRTRPSGLSERLAAEKAC